MKKTRLIIVIAATTLLTAGAGGAAAWWGMRQRAAQHAEGAEAAASAPVVDKRPQKYVPLDKVIVMLRRNGGEAQAHYLALDLVLKTPDEKEKIAKEHLPMLRSVVVKALSTYTLDKASGMSIEQFTEAINTAYNDTYAKEQHEKPFSEAMIGKLIIE